MANPGQIREACSDDLPALEDFFKKNLTLHRHLDWRRPIEWLGFSPFLMLQKNDRLQALLACPPDPPGVFWIRILASLFSVPIEECYHSLFPAALEIIRSQDKKAVITSIAYQDWMQSLLAGNGWEHCQQVVQLRWNRRKSIKTPVQNPEGILIRAMNLADIPEVAKIDQACFDFLWQHSEDALGRAFRQMTYCTVAEKNGLPIGYQITTLQQNHAHIARLAVLPEHQRNRIGFALVADVIEKHRKSWTREISVNTQADNFKSLNLYRKMGFEMTDESFPIYLFKN